MRRRSNSTPTSDGEPARRASIMRSTPATAATPFWLGSATGKARYLDSKLPKDCYVCDAPWDEHSFVFHHKTYKVECYPLIVVRVSSASDHNPVHGVQILQLRVHRPR